MDQGRVQGERVPVERWQKTLTVAAVAQVLSIVGFNFVVPFLPLYIQNLGVHGAGRVTFWAGDIIGSTANPMLIPDEHEISFSDKNLRALVLRFVEHELGAFFNNVWSLGVVTPVEEEELAVPCSLNALEELLRNDLVGVDIRERQRHSLRGKNVDRYH